MVCIPARSDGNPVYTSAPIASDDQNDPGDEEEDVKILWKCAEMERKHLTILIILSNLLIIVDRADCVHHADQGGLAVAFVF